MMPERLTAEQAETYREQGIVFPIRVFSEDEASRYAAHYRELAGRLGGTPRAVQLSLTHLYLPWSYELATHPAVLDAVEMVLGPDILVWSSSIFPKKARDPSFISMHQDGTYWGLSSPHLVVTAWVALTPSTRENGCMRVVPGSHREPIHPHRETYAENNLLTRGQEVQVDVDESRIADVELRPGEMSLHHVNLIHGSNANSSNQERIGFAIRFISPAVEQTSERHPAVLARGRDAYGHFELFDGPPRPASLDEAIAAQAAAARKHLEALTQTRAAIGQQ